MFLAAGAVVVLAVRGAAAVRDRARPAATPRRPRHHPALHRHRRHPRPGRAAEGRHGQRDQDRRAGRTASSGCRSSRRTAQTASSPTRPSLTGARRRHAVEDQAHVRGRPQEPRRGAGARRASPSSRTTGSPSASRSRPSRPTTRTGTTRRPTGVTAAYERTELRAGSETYVYSMTTKGPLADAVGRRRPAQGAAEVGAAGVRAVASAGPAADAWPSTPRCCPTSCRCSYTAEGENTFWVDKVTGYVVDVARKQKVDAALALGTTTVPLGVGVLARPEVRARHRAEHQRRRQGGGPRAHDHLGRRPDRAGGAGRGAAARPGVPVAPSAAGVPGGPTSVHKRRCSEPTAAPPNAAVGAGDES